MTQTRFNPILVSILVVALLALAYLGLMRVWIGLRESLDAPGYLLKAPLREFFWGSLVVAALIGGAAFLPLKNWTSGHPPRSAYLMASGVMMLILGLVGMLVILPLTSSLSESGGLTPDFGHTLTYENFTGALWLFLLLTAFIPYVIGRLAAPHPRRGLFSLMMLATVSAPVYLLAYSLYLFWQRVIAP